MHMGHGACTTDNPVTLGFKVNLDFRKDDLVREEKPATKPEEKNI